MSWRVVLTETALEGLGDADKGAVTADLFHWVEHGPPRENRRTLLGAKLFEDELSSGFRVAYFEASRCRTWPWSGSVGCNVASASPPGQSPVAARIGSGRGWASFAGASACRTPSVGAQRPLCGG